MPGAQWLCLASAGPPHLPGPEPPVPCSSTGHDSDSDSELSLDEQSSSYASSHSSDSEDDGVGAEEKWDPARGAIHSTPKGECVGHTGLGWAVDSRLGAGPWPWLGPFLPRYAQQHCSHMKGQPGVGGTLAGFPHSLCSSMPIPGAEAGNLGGFSVDRHRKAQVRLPGWIAMCGYWYRCSGGSQQGPRCQDSPSWASVSPPLGFSPTRPTSWGEVGQSHPGPARAMALRGAARVAVPLSAEHHSCASGDAVANHVPAAWPDQSLAESDSEDPGGQPRLRVETKVSVELHLEEQGSHRGENPSDRESGGAARPASCQPPEQRKGAWGSRGCSERLEDLEGPVPGPEVGVGLVGQVRAWAEQTWPSSLALGLGEPGGRTGLRLAPMHAAQQLPLAASPGCDLVAPPPPPRHLEK